MAAALLNGCWLFPPMPSAFLPSPFLNQIPTISMENEGSKNDQKLEEKIKNNFGEKRQNCQTETSVGPINLQSEMVDRIGESARNRFGRPYISGRPLLLCDRQKIVRLYCEGRRKIAIAREIGVTHSCVSKVIRRYEETGELENKGSRTASCACPGEAENHDLRVCRHVRFNRFRAEQQKEQQNVGKMLGNRQKQKIEKETPQKIEPKKFSIEWILSC